MSWWREALPSLRLLPGLLRLAIEEGAEPGDSQLTLRIARFGGASRDEPEHARLARLLDSLFTQERLVPVQGSKPDHYRVDKVLDSGVGARPVVAAIFCVLAQQRGLKASLIHAVEAPLTLLELDAGRCICDTGAAQGTVWSADEWLRIQERAQSRPLDPFEVDDAFQQVSPAMLLAEISHQLHDHAVTAGDLTSALRHAKRRTELLPSSPTALLDCARLHAKLGMRAEAIDGFGEYLLRWPDGPEAAAVGMQLSMLL